MVGIEARSSERNQLSTYLIQNSEEVRAVVAAAATHSNRIIQQKEEEKKFEKEAFFAAFNLKKRMIMRWSCLSKYWFSRRESAIRNRLSNNIHFGIRVCIYTREICLEKKVI